MMPWNRWLHWSGGGLSDLASVNLAQVDLQLPGIEGRGLVSVGPASTVGLLSCSLKPHYVGDGEKNGNTTVSLPHTGLLCLGWLHSAMQVQVGWFVPFRSLLCLPGALLGFNPSDLKDPTPCALVPG